MSFRGFRNNYREGMPFIEMLIKDVKTWLKELGYRSAHKGKTPSILTFPDYPSKRTTIQAIAYHLKFRLTNKPLAEPAVVLFFEDSTEKPSFDLPELKKYHKVLNHKCRDISKKKVDNVHQDVFGYCTIVDPTTHKGSAVEKSDENAMHDGRVIQCPVTVFDQNKVYQVVINNKHEDGVYVDYRVPVMGNEIPILYCKFKTEELRFTNDVFRSTLHEPLEFLSQEEMSLITEFAGKMDVDFAELDVLRDNDSGQLYIIDVNTTPYGPPAGLSHEDRTRAIHALSAAFKRSFL